MWTLSLLTSHSKWLVTENIIYVYSKHSRAKTGTKLNTDRNYSLVAVGYIVYICRNACLQLLNVVIFRTNWFINVCLNLFSLVSFSILIWTPHSNFFSLVGRTYMGIEYPVSIVFIKLLIINIWCCVNVIIFSKMLKFEWVSVFGYMCRPMTWFQ